MNNFDDEKHLLEALSHEDKKAFELLFMTYYPKIKQFLSGFLDSIEEGEDLAQDVFVKVWQKRRSFAYVENLNAYLYRIAKNILYDHIEKSRKNHRTISDNELADIPSLESVEELIFADELNDLINLKIKQMPHQRRTIFTMSRHKGLSNQEIATHLNISKRTVETHISAALAELRKISPLLILFF